MYDLMAIKRKLSKEGLSALPNIVTFFSRIKNQLPRSKREEIEIFLSSLY